MPFSSSRFIKRSIVLLLLAGVGLLLVKVFMANHEGGRQSRCRGQMSQIEFALLQYYDFYGSLPPAYIANHDGTPMHSWRILILPYLDGFDIYEKYDFSEP